MRISRLLSFLHQRWLVVFYGSLNDRNSLVSRTHLSILANLYNAKVWIVSIRPPICKSSRSFYNLLGTIPNAVTTIAINDTIFPSFILVLWQGPSNFFLFMLSLISHLRFPRTVKTTIRYLVSSLFFFFFFFC